MSELIPIKEKVFYSEEIEDEPLPFMDSFLAEHTQREVLPHPNGSVVAEKIPDNEITSSKVKPSVRASSHDLVFSATDADTVAWAAGTITLADGTSYSIDAGNTGNMTARTYIYLDVDVSTTVLQVSTTFGDAVGDGKILLATAENHATEATFFVLGGIGGINVDANNIVAATLAAISADLGAITAGNITLDASGFIKAGATAYMTGVGFWIGYDTSAYKWHIGDPSGDYISWDGSILTVKGTSVLNYKYSAGDILVSSANTSRDLTHTTPTLMKEIETKRGGTLRIKFTLSFGSAASSVKGQIYRNGSPVGTLRSISSGTTEFSEDIADWSGNDLIQLYAYYVLAGGGTTPTCSNFRIYTEGIDLFTVNTD